jgi:alkanesulfonate monooxygenase SsuD/methylene tetrahydromethanopterin reductase-like flavin-dependent oxidoreductase (luciferase family)
MEEMLQILPQAWSGSPFRHRGRIYDLPELGVRPVPTRPIPILVGGGVEAAIRRAARLADGIFANAPVDQFLQQVAWLEDECDKIGRDPSQLRIVHYSVMLPADSRQEALDGYTDHLWHMAWKYSDMEASATRSGPPPAAPPFDGARQDTLFGRATIAGTEDQIVTYLLDIRARARLPVEFAARSFLATLHYPAQVELMERLARGVAPHI